MSIITDATLEQVRQQIIQRNNRLRDFAKLYARTTWDNVRLDVKTLSPEALAEKYPIGTQMICGYTLDGVKYDFPWVVLDNNRECEWEDGSVHPGLWLGARYATIEEIQFDAPEQEKATEETAQEGLYYCGKKNNTYTMLNLSAGDAIPYSDYDHVYHGAINRMEVFATGYNRWSHSAKRQWLNSDRNAGEWWTPQHIGDSAPNQLSIAKKGFMAGLDDDFLSVVHPVKVRTVYNSVIDGEVTDITIDSFFLQSVEEIYGVPDFAGVEGTYFPYWKEVMGISNPTNYSNEARKIPKLNTPTGNATYMNLRSIASGSFQTCWEIYAGGTLNYYNVNNSSSALPACVIS